MPIESKQARAWGMESREPLQRGSTTQMSFFLVHVV